MDESSFLNQTGSNMEGTFMNQRNDGNEHVPHFGGNFDPNEYENILQNYTSPENKLDDVNPFQD
jgi:hypothetical protein